MHRILVAEDDPSVRQALAVCLARLGYVVDQARSGPEAVDRVQRGAPDLLILDLVLPGWSGIEVLDRLQDARLLVPDRVLVLSAADRALPQVAQRFGTATLAKPFRLAQLREHVAGLLVLA